MIPSSYFSANVESFLKLRPSEILGTMVSHSQYSVDQEQRNAWEIQIDILKSALGELDGRIILEYDVPRIGSRIDAVIVTKTIIFAVEFKVGADRFRRSDLNQAWDYALDLKNFHQASHSAPILPVLVATESSVHDCSLSVPHSDGVYPPFRTNQWRLADAIRLGLSQSPFGTIDIEAWETSPYHPTPTIIEAAQNLYVKHSVDAIARHDAGAKNLKTTSVRVEELIDEAIRNGEKKIIFVTGVPGAGKTLVGLNVATKKRDHEIPTHAVYLSGNKPLVEVLREALARDKLTRDRRVGAKTRKGDIKQEIKAFIQLVHHFRDDGLRNSVAPADHVVIFDEAQRAWDQSMTANFMARKKKIVGFDKSEPQFLLSCMDRHKDWAVVVCLVGGGQEIYRGEAGISAWIDAVRDSFQHWHVHVSPNLKDSEYASGHALDLLTDVSVVHSDPALHLSISMRSFRAENVSEFVKTVLDGEVGKANAHLQELSSSYPIVITRNLKDAKKWIRRQARGTERFGLVASSSGQRLKPHAIDVRVEINPIHWFLNDATDTRSSFYLEDAATEFQIQGLELDWACVTWDADLRYAEHEWKYHAFRGTKWTNVRKKASQQYLLNAYRVLLTRARQGMVIIVPPGDPDDPTRNPEYYDSTFSYLREIGVPAL